MTVAAGPEMWATLVLTGVVIVAYASERVPVELTALGSLGALLLLFQLAPMLRGGTPLLGPEDLLRGFASPALVAVAALLVIGQAMAHTGAFEGLAGLLVRLARQRFMGALGIGLGSVAALSGVLNNTPIVVIFLPVLRALAERFGRPASAVLMPLSYAAILGGTLTLIGTSSNLLVAGELAKLGHRPLAFFDLTVPGLLVTLVGGLYVVLLPRWLPRRDPEDGLVGADGKQFVAELDVGANSTWSARPVAPGCSPRLAGVTVRLLQRGGQTVLPPFEDVVLQAGDVLIVAATRRILTDLLARNPGQLLALGGEHTGHGHGTSDLMLAEVMVKPASRMVGQTLDLTNFASRSRCTVLGVQRRAHMLRRRLSDLRLEAGDVLLLVGRAHAIEGLRDDLDVLPMEWSAHEMPVRRRAPLALAIFAAVVLPAALDLIPIVVTALLGALALIATDCINIRQAARAVERRIVLVIGSALALGTALEATGGAAFLADLVLGAMTGASPAAVLSAFFLVVALLTNILSNNACAVLFTPVAVNLAERLEAPVLPFALAVAFAANCSFATPIGYQTNLLVMGPGHYRFGDFLLAGTPLVLVVWLTFSVFVPWYYGL